MTHVSRLHGAPRRERTQTRALRRSEREARIRVTVVLASRTAEAVRADAVRALARQWPAARRSLSREELVQQYGATERAATAVADHFRRLGLKVDEVSLARRSVVLSGSVSAMARAFGVRPKACRHLHGDYRTFDGVVTVPRALSRDITAVLGLDNGPLLQRHGAGATTRPSRGVHAADVAAIYGFPAHATGRGQTIGIIALGGGFYEADLSRRSRKAVQTVEIAGASNAPAPRAIVSAYLQETGFKRAKKDLVNAGRGSHASAAHLTPRRVADVVWTLEASMDVQLARALAPGARVVVYFAPNTEAGKFEALMRALTDADGPDIVSCSWGNHEAVFTPSWVRLLDEIFQIGALAGITLCYSSGDDGAPPQPGGPAVHFPASSPHVLACGGTTLPVGRADDPEHCWSEAIDGQHLASTGGVSKRFPKAPAWQQSARVRAKTGRQGRGVPDVSARANLSPGYTVRIAGHAAGLGGGTSAAAPLWAALIARFNEALGVRCGYLTPLLYQKRCRLTFRDIRHGSNGAYVCRPSWDPCTGWGAPHGAKLLAALAGRRR